MRKFAILLVAFLMTVTLTPLGKVLAETAQTLSEESKIYVRLTQPFTVGEDKNTTAEFVDLPPEAIEFGLQGMQLNGQIGTKEEKDGSLTGTIDWTSVTSTGSQRLSKTLKAPLTSEFTANKAEKVKVGEKILAVGNLNQLAEKIVELDETVKEAEKATKEKETNTSTVAGLAPASSGSPASSSSPSTSPLSVSADVQTTTYEECDPFIDEGGLTVFKQRKTIVTGESGKVYSTSMCENYAKLADIQKKPGDCTYQWNYDQNATEVMEQWYYVDKASGEETKIGECRVSGVTYPIQPNCADSICPDYFDEANGQVFPQCAQGITVGGTWIKAPSGCQPQDGVSYAVETEYVMSDNGTADDSSDDYIVTHDDFVNGMSYPMIRKFYMHPTNGKTYLTEPVMSATESYSHKHDTAACGWVMDDENLQAQQMSNTYIKFTLDGVTKTRELQECAARVAPTPYTYIGIESNSTRFVYTGEWVEYTAPAGITNLTYTLVAGGENGGIGLLRDCFSSQPGHDGGKAGQWKKDQSLKITSGETVPVYVGKGGTYRYYVQNGASRYESFDPEKSYIGNQESSFAQIEAKIKIFPGTPANGMYGGNGAAGLYIDEDTPSAANGHNYRGSTLACSAGSQGFCTGGAGAIGWGAGGGGAPGGADASCNNMGTTIVSPGGVGADGVAILTFQTMRYLRPDGTKYDVPYNGD